MKKIYFAVPLLLTMLAGCAAPALSSNTSSVSDDAISPLPSVSASATPMQESSVQQLAAEIAGFNAQAKALEKEMDPDCAQVEYAAKTDQTRGLDGMTAISCFTNKGTMTIYAKTLTTTLEGMEPYPPEVSELVASTIDKAAHVAVFNPGKYCTEDATSESCNLALLNYDMHQPGLKTQIAKWGPYGG